MWNNMADTRSMYLSFGSIIITNESLETDTWNVVRIQIINLSTKSVRNVFNVLRIINVMKEQTFKNVVGKFN
jgi:hypothetical protein